MSQQKDANKKLAIKKIVKVEAAVRSGCTRTTTSQCGVGYRNG
jgi:hypothetical protein